MPRCVKISDEQHDKRFVFAMFHLGHVRTRMIRNSSWFPKPQNATTNATSCEVVIRTTWLYMIYWFCLNDILIRLRLNALSRIFAGTKSMSMWIFPFGSHAARFCLHKMTNVSFHHCSFSMFEANLSDDAFSYLGVLFCISRCTVWIL